MLKKKVEKILNEQIALEGYASFLYLSMASWCDKEGLEGCAKFMHAQSSEEREHMLRLFFYISESDGHALVPQIKQAPHSFESIHVLLEEVYEHEKKVTNAINKIVDLCYKENDYTTLNFMQWYVEEQREEEAQMRGILDKVKLIGKGGQSLYYIDKELDKINKAKEQADAQAANADPGM